MSHEAQRVSLEPGYVLHTRPYRDTSLLLEVFSRNHGRVGLVAKGVRKKKSPLRAQLQPYSPLLLSWSGKGELATLVDVECCEVPYSFKGKILLSGFYLNELLTRLLHRNDPHAELYESYQQALASMSKLEDSEEHSRQLQVVLRIFEKRLLQETGYGLVLEYDVADGCEIEPDSEYYYRIGEGPVKVLSLANEARDNIYRGGSLLSIENEEFSDPVVLRDAKKLFRAALDVQLGGKPLNSRKLLLELQRTTELYK